MTNLCDEYLTRLPDSVRTRLQTQWQALQDKLQDPQWVSQRLVPHQAKLCKVWASSEFVSSSCAVHPALLMDLINSNDLLRRYPERYYQHTLHHLLAQSQSEQQLQQSLRKFRNREMIRIAWRDIAGDADLSQTMADLSSLADACITETLDWLHRVLVQELGQPSDDAGQEQRLLVLAMGKLGAYELNFSSDIDLIFVYPSAGETVGGVRTVSNEEFFNRVSKQLITALNSRTADGIVFRVDMRLRPFGDSGPLVVSLEALENYYQAHGREWERYAFIKARVVTGGAASSDEVMQMINSFVYRRYLDYGAFESLREMKQMIVAEVKRKGFKDNIKLGDGGIREIEFIGQAFQLIRGGRSLELRQKQILRTLEILGDTQLLPGYVVNELKYAYQLLRITENRLQQKRDAQTHSLPTLDDDRAILAISMGYESWEAFYKILQTHRQRVRSHFEQVFMSPQISQSDDVSDSFQLKQIWLQKMDDNGAITLLDNLGYQQPRVAFDHIKAFASSSTVRVMSHIARQRLDALMPLVIASVAPNQNAHEVLDRILELIQAISRRSSYLSLLLENPMALSQLIRLCAASPWIARQLKQYPLLLDELLDPRTLYKPPGREQLELELSERLAHIDSQDMEQHMDVLRQFKHASVLRVAAADISGAVPLMVVSDYLTAIAETVLGSAMRLAWQQMVERYGTPSAKGTGRSYFAIIAYGKMGGIEMSYSSDLDLVFLYDADPSANTHGDNPIANAVFYARLGQRLIHILTAYTAAGQLYEVDMRLRPSGESGMLVSHIDSFRDYQLHKAWTWEHQALVRARAVTGDHEVMQAFEQIRQKVLRQDRDRAKLRQEIVDMRERMRKQLIRSQPGNFDLKQDEGGITDIEFMVQYMALAWAKQYANLVTYSDNIRILDAIAENHLMDNNECRDLADIYRILRRDIHKSALQGQAAQVLEHQVATYRDRVSQIWQKYMLGIG